MQRLSNPSAEARTAQPRPKLTLRSREIVPANDAFAFVWVTGRRAPRVRYATAREAVVEAKRLRRELGLDAHAYSAVRITEDSA
jgi:hypothetical protein